MTITAEPDRASIVIRTYRGRQALLRRAIRSVMAQTYGNLELVVVEDGSDDSHDLVAEHAAGATTPITYLTIEKAGRSAAGNAGVAQTTGEHVGFLDDDDELLPDHVAVLAAALAEHSGAPAAYAGCVEIQAEVDTDGRTCPQDRAEQVLIADPFSLERLWQYNFMPIQSVLFRRSSWDRHGGFDSDLTYFEDWDLWLRLAMSGDFEMVPEVTSRYRIPANDQSRLQRERHHGASKPAIRRKQRSLVSQLPRDRRFAGVKSILSGDFDRINRAKDTLASIPLLRSAWRRLIRLMN